MMTWAIIYIIPKIDQMRTSRTFICISQIRMHGTLASEINKEKNMGKFIVTSTTMNNNK